MTPDASNPAASPSQGSHEFERIEVSRRDEISIAVLKDSRLEDASLVAQCKSELLRFAGGGKAVQLVIDFSAVERASPIALSSLLLLQKSVQAGGGSLKICGLSPSMAEILKVARLDRILSIHDDIRAALGSP